MDALEAAFEEHYAPLLRLCTLLSGGQDTAEDLVQDAFLRLMPRVNEIGPNDRWPYLRRVAVNLWKNRLRRLALERRARSSPPDGPGTPTPSVEERDALWRLIRRVPVRQRACLVLRFYEDLPEREVAAILGCSVGTVKSQTSRALARLRRELPDEN